MCSGTPADVVQQCRGLHGLKVGLRHAEGAGQRAGIHLDAGHVVVSGLILGVDRERQRFDGGEMQLAYLLRTPAFLRELAREGAVSPVGAVPEGHDQQHAGDQPVVQLGHGRVLSTKRLAAR